MAKYYVQSGNVRMVVDADEPEQAALWIIHRTMQQVLPWLDHDDIPAQQWAETNLLRGIMVLGNTVRLNEQGFDRENGIEFDTFELLVQWHQLMIALDRLSSLLE